MCSHPLELRLKSIWWLFLHWSLPRNVRLPCLTVWRLPCCFSPSPTVRTLCTVHSLQPIHSLIFVYVPTDTHKHRHFLFPTFLSPIPPPPPFPLSVCFIMCVLSWHFTVLSQWWPASLALHPSVISPLTVCYLPVCAFHCSLSLSISALLYEMVCLNHLHFVTLTSIKFVHRPYFCCLYVCCSYSKSVCQSGHLSIFLSVSTDNERWSIDYFYWPLQTQNVSLASLDGEESIVIHQWLDIKKSRERVCL